MSCKECGYWFAPSWETKGYGTCCLSKLQKDTLGVAPMKIVGGKGHLSVHKSHSCEHDTSKKEIRSLRGMDFRGADLSGANLCWVDMSYANFRGANFEGANLSGAKCATSNFSHADFTGAKLAGTNFHEADLSQAKGLLDPEEWLTKHFEYNSEGLLVYARFCDRNHRRLASKHPSHWKFEEGQLLTETVNFDRCTQWGSGILFGTKEWWQNHWSLDQLWKCCIPWLAVAGVCIPYSTKLVVDNNEGFARCSKLVLLERDSTIRNMFYKDE